MGSRVRADRPVASARCTARPPRTTPMLLVRLDSLRPQMKLAKPVLHPDRDDLVLLNQGYVLNQGMIRKLTGMGVTHVWISVPGFEGVQNSVSQEVCHDHMQLYQILNRSIKDLEPRVAVKLNVKQYQSAVHKMLCSIIDRPNHDVVTNDLMMCGPQLAGHMANCSYLALLLGAHLSGYLRDQRAVLPAGVADNTEHLGLGALLHDIGKLNMPDSLRDSCILDKDVDTPEYRLHVTTGFEAVHEYISPTAATIVLHHHERYDGQGFPGREETMGSQRQPLAENSIHVFSRIVAVVDAFDRLLCAEGRNVPTIAAIHGIRSKRFKGWFDPVIVEALLRIVPPFMVGSLVRLSDGIEAVVVVNHPEAPCRPTVKLLKDGEDGSPAASRQLDLRMCRDLTIAEADGVDVSKYVFTGECEPRKEAA
jgi:HD-GYP domain-containing protein (c-di-GMP phosphodiesterase class II)